MINFSPAAFSSQFTRMEFGNPAYQSFLQGLSVGDKVSIQAKSSRFRNAKYVFSDAEVVQVRPGEIVTISPGATIVFDSSTGIDSQQYNYLVEHRDPGYSNTSAHPNID